MGIRVTVLGSTGTIGRHTLDVIDSLGDAYEVVCLAAGKNAERLAEQVHRFRPAAVAVQDDETASELKSRLSGQVVPDLLIGESGLTSAGKVPADVVVTGIVGSRGLSPTWEAIGQGATIALANKETLVAAGDLVMDYAAAKGAAIVPVDSEHSALFQCLQGGLPQEVERFILTASGGPFRTWDKAAIERATVRDALNHPTWNMGRKITVDSASLMNKGLEVIEAHHLFGVSYDKIDVVVHPQSIVHSMIEFIDGSVIAQMGSHDMRLPIQYALTYPERRTARWPKLDLVQYGTLTFEMPDVNRFPALQLAFDAGKMGGYAPCVLNAANEVAVEAFLQEKIPFGAIPRIAASVLDRHQGGHPSTIEDVLSMDAWARETARSII